MRNVKWLVAAGLLVSATGCVETNGYPGTSYPGGYGGYPSNGYYGGQPYYGQPANTYYAPQPAYSNGGGLLSGLFGGGQQTYYQQPQIYQQPQTRYVPVPVAAPPVVNQTQYAPRPRSSWGSRDRDGDGIPNRYDRDRNNDGIPDRQQRRGPTG